MGPYADCDEKLDNQDRALHLRPNLALQQGCNCARSGGMSECSINSYGKLHTFAAVSLLDPIANLLQAGE